MTPISHCSEWHTLLTYTKTLHQTGYMIHSEPETQSLLKRISSIKIQKRIKCERVARENQRESGEKRYNANWNCGKTGETQPRTGDGGGWFGRYIYCSSGTDGTVGVSGTTAASEVPYSSSSTTTRSSCCIAMTKPSSWNGRAVEHSSGVESTEAFAEETLELSKWGRTSLSLTGEDEASSWDLFLHRQWSADTADSRVSLHSALKL